MRPPGCPCARAAGKFFLMLRTVVPSASAAWVRDLASPRRIRLIAANPRNFVVCCRLDSCALRLMLFFLVGGCVLFSCSWYIALAWYDAFMLQASIKWQRELLFAL